MTIPRTSDRHQQVRASITLSCGAPFDDFRQLLPTARHAVYVLFDLFGRALYVGQSAHPRTRIRAHWRGKDWFPEVAAIHLYLAADEFAARTLEQTLAGELEPVHSEITWADRVRLDRLALAGAPQ